MLCLVAYIIQLLNTAYHTSPLSDVLHSGLFENGPLQRSDFALNLRMCLLYGA